MIAAHHPFDFARVGARHGRQHLADLVREDRNVPAFWTAAHPPDHLGLTIEDALGREMTDDEMDVYAGAFRDAYEAAVDEHAGPGALHITGTVRGALESHL